VSPRLNLAFQALRRDDDLKDFPLAALAFKVVVGGHRPLAVAHAVDDEGNEHWLGVRSAQHGAHVAYLQLFSDLRERGLVARGIVLVDTAGCRLLARRIEDAFGPVVHVGRPPRRAS
jgi:hypothetical protein